MNSKVLVTRNDKLGDFMLAWPTLMLLKQSLPEDDELWVLARDYTQDIAESCPWVDGVVVDHGDQKQLVLDLKAQNFSAAIALFSTWYVAKSLKQAKIPYRLAPATKVAQILYTHRLKQRRSQSLKAEYEYNLDLARHYLQHRYKQLGQPVNIVEPNAPIWHLGIARANQDSRVKHCFLHALNGGSSENLSFEQYISFCKTFDQVLSFDTRWTLTHGPGELKKIQPLYEALKQQGIKAELAPPFAKVSDFAQFLAQQCDVFVSSATGTLHLAAAINLPTVTFYPRKKASNATRWNTINSDDRKISFSPDAHVQVEDEAKEIMGTLDMDACARSAAQKFNRHWK